MSRIIVIAFLTYLVGGVGALLGLACGLLLYALGLVTPEAVPWFAVGGGLLALGACAIGGAA